MSITMPDEVPSSMNGSAESCFGFKLQTYAVPALSRKRHNADFWRGGGKSVPDGMIQVPGCGSVSDCARYFLKEIGKAGSDAGVAAIHMACEL